MKGNENMIRAPVGLVGLMMFASAAQAADASLSQKVEAFRKYLLETDYPEVFGDEQYRVRVEDVVVADVDNDGQEDVIALMQPHYRQSATILIYKVSSVLKLTRVREGLAPGPVQPLTGDYLDSHALGEAVDMTVQGKDDTPKGRAALLDAALKNFGGVVQYDGFLHGDARHGPSYFIDMTRAQKLPKPGTCDGFEFSTVKDIAVGALQGEQKKVLVAWVGNELWVYRIAKVREDGLLDKTVQVQKVPAGFKGFVPGKGLAYVGADGREAVLSLKSGGT
jgi:hypothetical protein